MTDVATNEPLRVSPGGEYGPHMRVSVPQLDRLRPLLDRHGVAYWLDESAVSFAGGPYIVGVNFSRRVDASQVQALLDAAP